MAPVKPGGLEWCDALPSVFIEKPPQRLGQYSPTEMAALRFDRTRCSWCGHPLCNGFCDEFADE
jgi:hypothetical protein